MSKAARGRPGETGPATWQLAPRAHTAPPPPRRGDNPRHGARPGRRRWIALLGLQPHPEGGWYRETWRAAESVSAHALPDRYGGPRAHGTAIYYLLAEGTISLLHRVQSDELWHFYAGNSVEMLQLRPDGSVLRSLLGPDITNGEQPQVVVPRGTWQGARLCPLGRRALLGCTVSPGFDFADFQLADADALIPRWPDLEDEIRALTDPTRVRAR